MLNAFCRNNYEPKTVYLITISSHSRVMWPHSASFSLGIALALCVVIPSVTSLQLYGCYLPDDRPNDEDYFRFQRCITDANGVSSAFGGRWGRSLRRTDTESPDKILNGHGFDFFEENASKDDVISKDDSPHIGSDGTAGSSILLRALQSHLKGRLPLKMLDEHKD